MRAPVAGEGARRPRGIPRALRPLAWFWAVVLVAGASGAAALQWAGAPMRASAPVVAAPALPALRPAPAAVAAPPVAESVRPVAAPDPALLEPSPDFPGGFLPRIGADRRSPMQAYAAAADPDERRPRIAILLAGIGLSRADGAAAIRDLPAAVSLAVSPYATRPAELLDAARARGHELLVSLPMEPRDYPADDPGAHALLTGADEAANQQQLDWALTRFTGYVGATGALGAALRGERFAANAELMRPVLAELARRGLLYVDPRPGAARPAQVVGRSVDVVLDDPVAAGDLDLHLAQLERVALARGSALGLAELPSPVTVAHLAAWARQLGARGLALAPVSAVVPLVPAAEAGP